MNHALLKLDLLGLSIGPNVLLQETSLTLSPGDHLMISGPSGSGKTILGKILAGIFQPSAGTIHRGFDLESIRYVSPQPWHDTTPERHYFENRYEVFHGSETASTIMEKLRNDANIDTNAFLDYLRLMQVEYVMDKEAGQLSNGESKILQLGMVLCNPRLSVLVLDKPLLGLDKTKREIFSQYLATLAHQKTFVIIGEEPVEGLSSLKKLELVKDNQIGHDYPVDLLRAEIARRYGLNTKRYETIVGMKEVEVYYGDTCILKDINWTVRQGEKWLVRGENGSGKSMLMSLITADNPKAYGQDLTLFDKKRGSGESVWEIKSKIGYVSPESHMFFLKKENVNLQKILQHHEHLNDRFSSKISCSEVIESGLYDRMDYAGGYVSKNTVEFMTCFGLEHLVNKRFAILSMGTQRILLLLRALIKNPALIIFDEPTQGLDDMQKSAFLDAVELICEQASSTVIYISHHLDEVPKNIGNQLILQNRTSNILTS